MATNRPMSLASKLKLGGVVIAAVVLVAFIALNFADVEVDLVIAQANTKLAFALIFTGLLGFVIGYFAPRWRPQ